MKDIKTNKFIILVVLLLVGCGTVHKGGSEEERIANGKILFQNSGCIQCHSLSGKSMYGPVLNDILNAEVEVLRKGKLKKLVVDRDYIRRSIKEPDYEKLVGFQTSTMPKPTLSKEEVDCITDYLIDVNQTSGRMIKIEDE